MPVQAPEVVEPALAPGQGQGRAQGPVLLVQALVLVRGQALQGPVLLVQQVRPGPLVQRLVASAQQRSVALQLQGLLPLRLQEAVTALRRRQPPLHADLFKLKYQKPRLSSGLFYC